MSIVVILVLMSVTVKTIIYFLTSVVITYVFIAANPVYNSFPFQLLAFGIAATVWGIQVTAAFIFLKEKKYEFLYNAGRVCFLGSSSLMLSVMIHYLVRPPQGIQLQISAINVLLSVLLMAILFCIFLKRLQLSYYWVIIWLLCLCIAVPLQAKLVGLL